MATGAGYQGTIFSLLFGQPRKGKRGMSLVGAGVRETRQGPWLLRTRE